MGAAGVGVFGCREAGFLLLGANLLSAVLLGMILHFFLDSKDRQGDYLYSNPKCLSLSQALPDCVSAAFSSTLGVCAYVILFSVLTALADCSGLLPFCVNALAEFLPGEQAPALCRSLLMGLMEISTGTAALREGAASPAAQKLLVQLTELTDRLYDATEALRAAIATRPEGDAYQNAVYEHDVIIPAMGAVRTVADSLETIVGKEYWPFPTYADLLFNV